MGDFADLTDAAYGAKAAPLVVRMNSAESPDKAAEALALSRRYNLTPALAQQFSEDYKSRAKTEDARATFDRAPRLGSWIAERPDRAQVVHDDLDNLGSIEQTIGRIASYALGARPNGGLPGMLGRIPQAVAAGFPGLGATMYGTASAPFEVADQGIQWLDDMAAALTGTPKRQIAGTPGAGSLLRGGQKSAQAESARWQPDMAGLGRTEREVLQGFTSFGQNLPALGLGLIGAPTSAVLGIMGASAGGASYGKARDAGASPLRSFALGAADATAEIVTEKFFGVAGLLKDSKSGMAFGKLFMRDIIREVPGEIGATTWQNLNEWALLNPDKPAIDWLGEQPDAIRQTIISTIISAGAQSATVRGIQKLGGDADRQAGLAQQAEETAVQAEQLQKLAGASKVMARDAQTVREFVAQVADEEGDAPTEFFIDGDKLLNTLNQSGMTMAELEAVAPVAAAQMDAASTGGLVRLPIGEFMNLGESAAGLIDNLRTTEDAPTRTEAREYMSGEGKALVEEVERELLKRDDADTYRESIAVVQQRFHAELDATKRFTPDVNKAYATLLANFYGATAARLGMTPDALLEKYQLRVQAKGVDGARVMNQGNVDGDESPMDTVPAHSVLYHGTGGQMRVSRTDSVLYLTTQPREAAVYARGEIPGTSRGSKGAPRVVQFTIDGDSNVKSIEGAVEEAIMDGDIDETVAAELKIARAAGDVDFLRYTHPSGVHGGSLQVYIPVYPESLIEKRSFDPADPNILNQSPANPSPETIELRKRKSVLESLLECMNA